MARTWILLRGLIREQRHWGEFPARMQDRFKGDRVVTLDLPGNGVNCHETSPDNIAGMVQALRAQCQQQNIEAPYHLVALSLGGMIGVQWLSEHDDEVAFLALINSSAKPFSSFWQRLRPSNYGRILRLLVTSPPAEYKEASILDMTSACQSPQQRQQLAAQWAEYARSHPVSRRNTLRQLQAATGFRAPPSLPSNVPVVIFQSLKDNLVHPKCSESLASHWHCPLISHPDTGHDLPLDDPQWLLDELAKRAP